MGDVGLFIGQEPKIALVFAVGNIIRGAGDPSSSDPQAASEKVAAAMRAAYTDPSVKGIVVRVDSRGGSAVASDSIRRELEKARSKGLPVVVSMGAYAASGGYYIATGADKIIAQPGTITGSIGAFFGKLNLKELFSNIGIDVDEIALGKDANFMNPALPLSESQRAKADRSGRQVYDDFVGLVADARKLSPEEVDRVARGRVWTGAQALKLQLVDELGGLTSAHRAAARLAKEGADAKEEDFPWERQLPLVEYPRPLSLAAKLAKVLAGEGSGQDGLSAVRLHDGLLSEVLLGSGSADILELWTQLSRTGAQVRKLRELTETSVVSLRYEGE